MSLTHWELRALLQQQLAWMDRMANAFPTPEAIEDFHVGLERLKAQLAMYEEAPKTYGEPGAPKSNA